VSAPQLLTRCSRIIPSVSLKLQRSPARPTTLALHCRNGIHQFESLSHIVGVSTSEPSGQRDPLSVSYDMMLATSLRPVGRVWARLVPPKTARTEALSSTALRQSNRPASCSRSKQARWMASHTPRRCQSRRRRQQVMPLPQLISRGNSSQGMPVLSTSRMPVRAWRAGTRGLPPLSLGLGGSGGSNGWINSHSSSNTIGLAKAATPFRVTISLNHIFRFC
jgi:hypothetical protein